MKAAYLAIDIETTGLDPERHQILEIAGVLNLSQMDVMRCPHFHFIVAPYGDIVGSPFALAMNQRLLRTISDGDGWAACNVVTEIDLKLNRWRKRYGIDTFHPLGKNVGGFDMQFLKRLEQWPAHQFSYRCLDVGSMYATLDGISGQSDLIDEIEKGLGIEGEEHQALHDARVSLELARRRFRDYIFNGMYGTPELCQQTCEMEKR